MATRFRSSTHLRESQSEKEMKKSALAKRRSRALKASRSKTLNYHLTYDQQNLKNTMQIPATTRSYGLMKTTQTSTPFPKQSPILDESIIRLRLEAEQIKGIRRSDDLSVRGSLKSEKEGIFEMETSTFTTSEGDFQLGRNQYQDATTASLSFEVRRRLFDEAEYTIAKGKKMGQNMLYEMDPQNNIDSFIRLHKVPGSYFAYFYDLDKMCRNFNIKMAKGFEF